VDFVQVHTKETKSGSTEVYPDFIVGRTSDLMVRGRAFYAVWDDDAGLWSRDEYDVQRLVDHELRTHAQTLTTPATVKYMRSFNSNVQNQFRRYVGGIGDNSHDLDTTLTFADTKVTKTDYASQRLSYSLSPGDISAWDELVGFLYSPEERAKIEWAIGAVVSGDSKKIQKFLVLYGSAGTGKSTVLNIIQKLFDGYTTSFEAKALGTGTNAFATAAFARNPLVAIQHDGDLSKIADNTLLNAIVSHEPIEFNEKYKAGYSSRSNAMLLMGTNQPVKISDAKSGIIRRLIDVHPTGDKLAPTHYHALMGRIDFELGAIANHCLEVYKTMGKNYYNSYQPLEMMYQTDIVFNFIEASYDVFKSQNGASLRQAYSLYKEYCEETGIDPKQRLPQYKFREEIRNYFDDFRERFTLDGTVHRNYFYGFNAHPFKVPVDLPASTFSLVMEDTTSIFDLEYLEQPAQYAKEDGTPQTRWALVKTTLSEIETSALHYVKLPENHIVIDFDLKDANGEKSRERNLQAASEFPATYGELSKSGAGVHLHYIYSGEVADLDASYTDGIEVKVFLGGSSLRRRLTLCNNVPIATISSGLPIKEKKPVLGVQTIQSERGLRDLVIRNLHKQIHPGTKPSIDFISKILEDAYNSPLTYDLTDMKGKLISFASNSNNQHLECLKIVKNMKFKSSEKVSEEITPLDDRIVFFDVEVYQNLFVICYSYEDSDTVVRMVNPKQSDIEPLFQMKLVGFNNRRYDNHILWAAFLGYDNKQLYELSQKIIAGVVGALFGEAYNLSYADIYDFSSVKMSLKKFEVLLGILHLELDIPWDQEVPKELWMKVVEYCVNDVRATKAVFKARHGDYVARMILAKLSGLTVNDTTQKHTARIIFGNDRNPQRDFVYTDLAKEFPGYEYKLGVSTYRGIEVGEGGYVYAEPGIYQDVALLDVASMHPTSIVQLRAFGEYTPRFAELLEARLAIKAGEYESARGLLGGRLAEFVGDDEDSNQALSDALKIVINIVYGLTSAKFDNPFRDLRNVDNIVAKRGALFMIDLQYFVQEQGFTVAHIKTDSIKIPKATLEIIEAVKLFGQKYGYDFDYNPKKDHYDKMALVNDAVFIAKQDECITPRWKAVGAQFQHPYVYKTLFERDSPVEFDDFCEAKSVMQGAMYLVDANSKTFVGRTGRFVPIREELGGYDLVRIKDDKSYAVAGTKGYKWVEADFAKQMLTNGEGVVDMRYFDGLANDAVKTIEKFGSFSELVN
jgi:hypothetical protein